MVSQRWLKIKSDPAKHARYKATLRRWAAKEYRATHPGCTASHPELESYRREEHERCKAQFGLTKAEAKQLANWIFRSLQVPGNLDPRQCKLCHRFFDLAPKKGWKCNDCRRASLERKRLNDPDGYREAKKRAKHNRRAKVKAGGTMWPGTWTMVLRGLGSRCLKCGAEDATLDHIIPLSLGGTNRPWNIQPLCHRCNTEKGATIADYRDPSIIALMKAAEDAAS